MCREDGSEGDAAIYKEITDIARSVRMALKEIKKVWMYREKKSQTKKERKENFLF